MNNKATYTNRTELQLTLLVLTAILHVLQNNSLDIYTHTQGHLLGIRAWAVAKQSRVDTASI